MDPILENEATTSDPSNMFGKPKNKQKKKKDGTQEQQTIVGEKKRFVVTTLVPAAEDKVRDKISSSNVHNTVHFGTRGVESQRPHVRSIFNEAPADISRPSSAERDSLPSKEYETFHGTSSSSPKSSIFDIFRLRRKSDAKKHQTFMQNVKAALGASSKSSEASDIPNRQEKEKHSDSSDKKYYHTVTGASSRKYSPMTRVMDIFKSKPQPETNQPSSDERKKHKQINNRRSSIETTSPTYHKNSYASLDPMQAKQLFREVRGLPKYDPYLSIVQISIGGRDKTKLLLNFFKYHKCYEMLPKSAKVIIFDTQFLVKKTFPTLISHGIRSAPLWDANKKLLVGMITVTDFIRILLHFDATNLSTDDLERHTLHNWKKMLRPSRKHLCLIGPDQSLHEAINMLNKNRVHRLLMVDHTSGDVLYILSHKRILRFLFVYLNEFPELTFFHKTLKELKIGTYEDILSITDSTNIRTTFHLLLDKDISALPVLDEDGKLLDVYAKYEVLNLVNEKLYSNLSLTIAEVRHRKKDWEEKLQKCRSSITLYEALEVIVRTESHRLLLVNQDDKLIGIVSLSDILVYLNRIIPTEKKVSSLQELFRPLEENKVPESSRENEHESNITIDVPSLPALLSTESTTVVGESIKETEDALPTEDGIPKPETCHSEQAEAIEEINETNTPENSEVNVEQAIVPPSLNDTNNEPDS